MCGRFVAASPRDVLADHFDIEVDGAVAELPLSYNVAPTDEVVVVREDSDGRALRLLSWGLSGRINARAETLTERPLFHDAFLRRRCLLPADGFYEWETLTTGNKQPWLFSDPGRHPLALAGVWTAGECAIVTTAAVAPVARLHERMPVVVQRDDWAVWLRADTRRADLDDVLHAAREVALTERRVSTRVNDVRNNDPSLLEPAPPPPEPLPLF